MVEIPMKFSKTIRLFSTNDQILLTNNRINHENFRIDRLYVNLEEKRVAKQVISCQVVNLYQSSLSWIIGLRCGFETTGSFVCSSPTVLAVLLPGQLRRHFHLR